MTTKKEVKISEVLSMLAEGKSREQIAEHYGIPMSEMKKHFKHEKLKGKKTARQLTSVLVDDTEGSSKVDKKESTNEVTQPDAVTEIPDGQPLKEEAKKEDKAEKKNIFAGKGLNK